MADSDTATETDHALHTLRRLFPQSKQEVTAVDAASPLGDYQIEITDGCLSDHKKDALRSLGFEEGSTHVHTAEVADGTVGRLCLYVNDPRNDGGA